MSEYSIVNCELCIVVCSFRILRILRISLFSFHWVSFCFSSFSCDLPSFAVVTFRRFVNCVIGRPMPDWLNFCQLFGDDTTIDTTMKPPGKHFGRYSFKHLVDHRTNTTSIYRGLQIVSHGSNVVYLPLGDPLSDPLIHIPHNVTSLLPTLYSGTSYDSQQHVEFPRIPATTTQHFSRSHRPSFLSRHLHVIFTSPPYVICL